MRLAILIAALLAGCTAAPANDASTETQMDDTPNPEPYSFRQTYDLTEGINEGWSFETHEEATVVAKFYSVGNDAALPGTFCFKAKIPGTTYNQCNEGNANIQIGPAIVTGKTSSAHKPLDASRATTNRAASAPRKRAPAQPSTEPPQTNSSTHAPEKPSHNSPRKPAKVKEPLVTS